MSNIWKSIESAVPPINREGYPFIGIFAVLTLGMGFFSTSLFWIGLILTVWCALFFRDPARVTAVDDGLVIAPADGRVCLVGHRVPPPELELGDQPMMCVGIFMNVFDVHVNRAPVSGRVFRVAYKPGAFFNADLDKASEQNERNGFVFDSVHGKLAAVQIAGLVARRIVPWSREGEEVTAGDRIGMIRFGSRVDVYMPEGLKPVVNEGQRTVAGETWIALAESTSAETIHTARVG